MALRCAARVKDAWGQQGRQLSSLAGSAWMQAWLEGFLGKNHQVKRKVIKHLQRIARAD
jgi:hypothetical protein